MNRFSSKRRRFCYNEAAHLTYRYIYQGNILFKDVKQETLEFEISASVLSK